MTQEIPFLLESDYGPGGDQPQAIQELVQGVEEQKKHQVLLGITGSGKTFTMANVIRELQRDRKSTRLNSSHVRTSRMPSSA